MKLRQARKKSGLSLAELGDMVSCTATALSDIERGVRSASLELAQRICAALPNVDPWTLVKHPKTPWAIVLYLNGPHVIAEALSIPLGMVMSWKSANTIPEEHWPSLERLALSQGKIEVSEDLIARLHGKGEAHAA